MTCKIYCKSSANMSEVADGSVAAVITSPPYNVGINYDVYDDNLTLKQWLVLMLAVFDEAERVLMTGGRLCINIAIGTGRQPFIPIGDYLNVALIERGWLMRGSIIWSKGAARSASTAWGSFRSPRNPCLRDEFEAVHVFSKDDYARPDLTADHIISQDRFIELTKSHWSFIGENVRRSDHPAPYPIELPARLIELFTAPDDVVLDCFAGVGTTGLAANALGRHFIGYDISPDYCRQAQNRCDDLFSDEANKVIGDRLNRPEPPKKTSKTPLL